MKLVFEWDAHKARANWRKHGIRFEEAKTIFNDSLLLTYPDDFHSYGEERYISLGHSHLSRLLLVVHTEQTTANNLLLIRIISCRRATTAEQETYEHTTP